MFMASLPSQLKQLHYWTKYIKQQFSDIVWQAAQQSDLWGKRNKWDSPNSLPRESLKATVQSGTTQTEPLFSLSWGDRV